MTTHSRTSVVRRVRAVAAVAALGVVGSLGVSGSVVASPGSTAVAQPAATSAAEHERAVEVYFDELALHLSEPGVWVAPESQQRLSGRSAAELDRAAKGAPVPMRIAVIPASVLAIPDERAFRTELLWESPVMATELYERVGLDGVYAILVDADSSDDGRGFWGVQHADSGPTYNVESAVDQAVDCCAPDYHAMLDRFIDRASQVKQPWYLYAAVAVGVVVVVFALWWFVASRVGRRQQRDEERLHVFTVQPLLNEEVIELSEKVSTLPATSDIEQALLTREILDAVEKARHRLDALEGDDDIRAVTTLLGDARYLLHCLTAMYRGEPRPERTPPCFFDPRHGPSTAERQWSPSAGAERTVNTCTECAERIDADETPDARVVDRRSYWSVGEHLVAYIEGYWSTDDGGTWRFPERRHYEARRTLWERRDHRRPAQRLNRGAQRTARLVRTAAKEIAKESSTSGRGGGRSGGSFGGGSSRSSSSRSSGGRRF
ncbi:hypothetical protein [Phytoactinopolyspora limicola]|uniref:hypothetical protein n=1 Tax=Phytoactinopolyspora limicola TaxID=2715536 RepID=UPI00140A6226|nr:hypothetical protein [Phytoactinopolyspora limicola]